MKFCKITNNGQFWTTLKIQFFCLKWAIFMAKNEFWMKKHDIWQLKLKNQNRSKIGFSIVQGLLHKTSNRFSTYLCRDRSILKILYLVLCKCSTFGNWMRKSDDFLKNSVTLVITYVVGNVRFVEPFSLDIFMPIEVFSTVFIQIRFDSRRTLLRPLSYHHRRWNVLIVAFEYRILNTENRNSNWKSMLEYFPFRLHIHI